MEKQSLERRDLLGWVEGMTFREMGQQVGNYFIAVKKLARGGTTNHEVFMICQFLFQLANRQHTPLTNQIPTLPLQKWA